MSGQPPEKKSGRGHNIAIVVLSISVAVLLGVIVAMMMIDGTKISPQPQPIYTPTLPPSPTPSATSSASASSSPTPTTESACTTGDLRVALGSPDGAAGSTYLPIEFTNTSSSACTLTGYPGVSFVGDGNGTQLGAAADWASTPSTANTLQPGSTVTATLQVADAVNYASSQCNPKQPDGFRIYPPHSRSSVFVADTSFTACTNSAVHLLTVTGPVAPAG